MIVSVKDGVVSMPLSDVLRQCDATALHEIIDTLACESEVITQVMNQILEGWTDMASCGYRDVPANAEPHSPIDQARRRIAEMADKVSKEVIEELQHALKKKTEEFAKLQSEHQAICDKLRTRILG